MKILLVAHFFPPRNNAGTENYTLGLAKSLQLKGNEVQVLCAEDWDFGASYWNGVTEEKYQGVPVKRIHINWSMADDPNQVLYYSKKVKIWFSQLLEIESFDIVHIISAYSLGVGIMESVKGAQIPLILTLMDFWFLCPSVQLLRSDGELCDGLTTASQCESCLMLNTNVARKISSLGISPKNRTRLWGHLSHLPIIAKQRGFRGRLLNMSERKQLLADAIKLPELVLTHSNFVKEMFANHTDRDIEVLKNGHDLSWLDFHIKKKPSDKLRIGYVGQIVSIKGVHILIKAFKDSKIAGKAKLEIWGGLEKDVNYVGKLRALIDHDPSISLNGRFEHNDLSNVLSNIDILVVPSIWFENAPLVIQESFAAQTPVIVTKLGGMAEMVSDEVNGLLFERGNTNDLDNQFQRIINEPRLLERLKLGIPKVKTIEKEAAELEKIYFELMQSRKINSLGKNIL